jgi:predicted HTH transcriptional regulator
MPAAGSFVKAMNPIETLTDEALLLKLRNSEHDFVERKPRGQKGDWLQAAVAFANSAPIGWPAVLFVGVDIADEKWS